MECIAGLKMSLCRAWESSVINWSWAAYSMMVSSVIRPKRKSFV